MKKPQRDEKGRFLPMIESPAAENDSVSEERLTRMEWNPCGHDFAVMTLTSSYPMPSRWHRFWSRALMGVHWKYVDDDVRR